MKRFTLLLLVFCSVMILSTRSVNAEEKMDIIKMTQDAGYTVDPKNKPKSSIVINAQNGDILWEESSHKIRDPASMSKMFTLYLLFEAIERNELSIKDTIRASENDQAISNIYEISNNKIVAGVDYPISDLITMVLVPSSNAATVMIANYLSDNNPDLFLDKINATAKRLGMVNTRFTNASGAAAVSFKGHYSPKNYDNEAPNQTTAHDLAILTYWFLKK